MVMEFIPSVQNITHVLNRGPAMEELVLSPANTLGLPYGGQAKETVTIACNRQTASDSCAHHPVRPRAIGPGTKDASSQASLSLLSAVVFIALFPDLCLFLLLSFACHSVVPPL